jgi:hypothetical protein
MKMRLVMHDTGTIALVVLMNMELTCHATPPPAQLLLKIGATAEVLAASQVQEPDLAVMVANLNAAGDLLSELETAETALASATSDASTLSLALREGACEADLQNEYEQIISHIQTLRDQANVALNGLFTVACTELPPSTAQRLSNCRSSAQVTVPASYRVLSFDTAQWRSVEEAVRARERAERLAEDLPALYANLLESIESTPDVINAAFLLESHLDSMQVLIASLSLPD